MQIEATPSELTFRVINSSKSACFAVRLDSAFFDSFVLLNVPSLAACVLLKVGSKGGVRRLLPLLATLCPAHAATGPGSAAR